MGFIGSTCNALPCGSGPGSGNRKENAACSSSTAVEAVCFPSYDSFHFLPSCPMDPMRSVAQGLKLKIERKT